MIYKIVGSLILVVGTAALGVYYAGQYMERLRNLIELKKALMQMQGELRYLHSAMPDLLETIGNRTQGVLSRFFLSLAKEMEKKEQGDFASLWDSQIKKKYRRRLWNRKREACFLRREGSLPTMTDSQKKMELRLR